MPSGELTTFGPRTAEQLLRELRIARSRALTPTQRRRRDPIAADEGGCDRQNAIWDIALLGNPDGGTFVLNVTVNGVTTPLTFDYDDDATDVATVLATHSEIGSSDIDVTGTFPSQTMRIEFIGDLASTDILQPTADWSNLSGGAGLGIVCQLAQKGHA